VFVLVVVIGAVMAVGVLVLGAVVMLVGVRVLVAVARLRVVVHVDGPVIVLVRQVLFHRQYLQAGLYYTARRSENSAGAPRLATTAA
jgi:hypothetical protein